MILNLWAYRFLFSNNAAKTMRYKNGVQMA